MDIISSLNMQEPRACILPFGSLKAAECYHPIRKRYISDRIILLNGKWGFRYFNSRVDMPKKLEDVFAGEIDQVDVPSTWQATGYESPVYLNVAYPIPATLPYVPKENPVGAYRRFFQAPSLEPGNRVYLKFEGVCSKFELYVNGSFVGMSKGSHLPSEFDITDYLKKENELWVFVDKWCDTSFLENQDMFRQNGIFRDVYLIIQPQSRIRDYYVKTEKDEARIGFKVHVDFENAKGAMLRTQIRRQGEIIFDGFEKICDDRAELFCPIPNPEFWSAEVPNLYQIFLVLCENEQKERECVVVFSGLKEIKIRDKVYYFNGAPIKLYGVNRHDTHPLRGYAMTAEDLEKDVLAMKGQNINCIRTSHYPPAPILLDMADEYGLYVVDEADIEAHGCYFMDGVKDLRFGQVGDGEIWLAPMLDRTRRMFLRDRSHACIAMWSLGNESGGIRNHDRCYEYLKKEDPETPVQYEPAVFFDRKGYDVVSMMYPRLEQVVEHCTSDNGMPFFMCEYLHAMGRGPGGYEDYAELMERYDSCLGGCIWEWRDHVVEHSDSAKYRYTYGGEHGEYLHDSNFCVDGMMLPDLTPSSSAAAISFLYRPITASVSQGVLSLRNRNFFKDTQYYRIYYRLLIDGKESDMYRWLETIPPRKVCSLDLNRELKKLNKAGNISVEVIVETQNGERVSSESLAVQERVAPLQTDKKYSWKVCSEDERYVTLASGDEKVCLDLERGAICSWKNQEFEIINQNPLERGYNAYSSGVKGFRPNIWRAPTDNDMYIKSEWFSYGFNQMWLNVLDCRFEAKPKPKMTVRFDYTPPKYSKKMDVVFEYVFMEKGVQVQVDFIPFSENLNYLPRLGVMAELNSRFDSVQWFGTETETYPDFIRHSRVLCCEKDIDLLAGKTVRPQEGGNRSKVSWAVLKNSKNNIGFYISATDTFFNFNAAHRPISSLEKARHEEDLVREETTLITVDLEISGLGSQSCGWPPKEEERASLKERKSYSFILGCL